MNTTLKPRTKTERAAAINGVCLRLWANAALPRVTGLGGAEAPEPDKPSRRFARHPLSHSSSRESGGANNAPDSNK